MARREYFTFRHFAGARGRNQRKLMRPSPSKSAPSKMAKLMDDHQQADDQDRVDERGKKTRQQNLLLSKDTKNSPRPAVGLQDRLQVRGGDEKPSFSCSSMTFSTRAGIAEKPIRPQEEAVTASSLAAFITAGIVPPLPAGRISLGQAGEALQVRRGEFQLPEGG